MLFSLSALAVIFAWLKYATRTGDVALFKRSRTITQVKRGALQKQGVSNRQFVVSFYSHSTVPTGFGVRS